MNIKRGQQRMTKEATPVLLKRNGRSKSLEVRKDQNRQDMEIGKGKDGFEGPMTSQTSASASSSLVHATPFDRVCECVRLVLNSWPSYQFAIKNQLGGAQTFAKDKWFCEALAEHLYKHADLYVDELSEWIGDVLNSEFDTISDDQTLDPTAELLIKMASWTLGRGKDSADEAKTKLDMHLQRLREIGGKQAVAPPQKVEDSSSEEEDDASDEN